MRLSNDRLDSIELSIVEYQFPKNVESYWDSNWLVVRISAASRGKHWERTSPCLLTFEIEALAKWLRLNREGLNQKSEISFVEPTLSFERVDQDERERLRVYFEIDGRPEWLPSRSANQRDFWLEFDVHGAEWNTLAIAAKAMLERHAVRVRR